MKDFFLRTYQKKSDAELEKIADAKGEYEMDAREAAIEILGERRGDSLEIAEKKLEFETEKVVAQERKELYSHQLPDGLHMYSETVVLVFTVLFSPLVGGILLYLNFQELENKKQANNALAVGLLFFTIGVTSYYTISATSGISLICNLIAAAIFSFHFWVNHIGRKTEYYRKSWVPPLMITIGVIIGLWIVLSVIVAIILNS